ncbi:MAG: FAD-dependent oxidoreductase, partial [Dokdonella sp.]
VRGEPTRWFGARPTLPDYLPAIGRCRAVDNVLYAFGHQHLGLTLAAITGELIAQLAAGEATDVALAPFDLARFGKLRLPR